jgi:hypothetical protein
MSDRLSAANPTINTPGPESSIRTGLEKSEPRLQLDAAASAALALAVRSAGQTGQDARAAGGARRPRPDAAGCASPENQAKSSRTPARGLAFAALALAALAAGGLGAHALQATGQAEPGAGWRDMAQLLRENRESAIGLAEDAKAIKADLEGLRQALDRTYAEAGVTRARLEERLEHARIAPRPIPPETAATLVRMGVQLERLEAGAKDPTPKLDALLERLERIERRIAAPTPVAVQPADGAPRPAAPDVPAPTGDLNAPPALKNAPVAGWVLHEVNGGTALIESRNRRLVEVAAGEMVPGVGRVQAIERRGKRWVVVTTKGVIGTLR